MINRIAGFNGLSEALKRLDFRNAIRDTQRFNYICKFLDLLITKKLSTLTGGAQKMLFSMLEEVTLQVSCSQQNLHVLHRLLENLQKRIEDYLWWGSMLGSVVLWERQRERFLEINSVANNIEINSPDENSHPTIEEIPQECVREIVKRLDNHIDIISTGQAYSVVARMANEQSIWKELCHFHWDRQQVEYLIKTHKEFQVKRDWEHVYHRLRRTYGLRETYANMILLCKKCQCLFWESLGHPCIVESNPEINDKIQTAKEESVIRVPPKVFLSYFSI
ncbi:F-box only protein 32 [Armadillidium nasatum]|uniref:F-box only protein 32 n=1 Tax=Armadillidium nasatum TaxID=96803 RepID=A0A5N5SP90_9CRUS|nr:F-box only protein 32 [Armadillidium nasatum]